MNNQRWRAAKKESIKKKEREDAAETLLSLGKEGQVVSWLYDVSDGKALTVASIAETFAKAVARNSTNYDCFL